MIFVGGDSEMDTVDAEQGTSDWCEREPIDVVTNCELLFQIDATEGLGEASLRLQMLMDRFSKEMNTLSNVLKTLAETSARITSNVK